MARQSFISNLGGYALKKLRLLTGETVHEYDTTQPVEVTIPDANASASSIMYTGPSDWKTWDGTTPMTFKNDWNVRTAPNIIGDKVDMKIKDGEMKYRIAVKKLGIYHFDTFISVKWESSVNKTGKVAGFPLDFSKPFEIHIGQPKPTDFAIVNLDAQDWYFLGVGPVNVDGPVGVQVAVSCIVTYIGPVEET